MKRRLPFSRQCLLMALLLVCASAYPKVSAETISATRVAGTASLMTVSSAQTMKNMTKTPVQKVAASETSATVNSNDSVADTIITSQPAGELVLYAERARNKWQSNGNTGDDRIDYKVKKIVRGDDGYIYIQDFMDHLDYGTWIKGRVEGDSLFFSLPQPYYEMGDRWSYRLYTIRAFDRVTVTQGDETYYTYVPDSTCTEMKFVIKGDSIINANGDKLFGLANATYGDSWSRFSESEMTYFINRDTLLTMPADFEASDWSFQYGSEEERTGHLVKVAFDDDDNVYVKGLCPDYPEAVVKGKRNNNQVTFPTRQYAGINEEKSYYDYLMASEDSIALVSLYGVLVPITVQHYVPQVTFDFDEENKVMTTSGNWALNHGVDSLFYGSLYTSMRLAQFNLQPVRPANPEWVDLWSFGDEADLTFYVYPEDSEGNFIDPSHLSYVVYTDSDVYTLKAADYDELDEDITEIPWSCDAVYNDGNYHSFDVYATGFNDIGIQTVYTVNGVESRSDIVYYKQATSIRTLDANKTVDSVWYTDLSGRRVGTPAHGIYVKVTQFTDGSKKVQKMMLK